MSKMNIPQQTVKEKFALRATVTDGWTDGPITIHPVIIIIFFFWGGGGDSSKSADLN